MSGEGRAFKFLNGDRTIFLRNSVGPPILKLERPTRERRPLKTKALDMRSRAPRAETGHSPVMKHDCLAIATTAASRCYFFANG